MKISIKQLGAIEQAEFEVGAMTVICGQNNTGKTYATHASFGFLDFLLNYPIFLVNEDALAKLFKEGTVIIELRHYTKELSKYLKKAAKQYSKSLFRVFAGHERLFKKSVFDFSLQNAQIELSEVHMRFGSAEKHVLKIDSSSNNDQLEISLIIDKTGDEEILPKHIIKDMIADGIKSAIFKNIIPTPFLASAERTGAAIFQKELDFTRNRLVELLGDRSSKLHPVQVLGKFSGEYPIAVRKNVDFIRDIPNITNKESFLVKKYPELLKSFGDIIGGEYIVTKDGIINYVPLGSKRTKLSLVESSSAVRSLLDVGFYLRHIAQKGDLLMVDEPELNLHPENQRLIARLFARLVNVGIKVFITTHSDYIIKELNTLIMLNQDKPYLKKIMMNEKYFDNELLSADKIKVYIAKEDSILKEGNVRKTRCLTLVPADVSQELGIEIESFDTTIDEMNRIQEAIIWGDDE
jgi:predicted ATPase